MAEIKRISIAATLVAAIFLSDRLPGLLDRCVGGIGEFIPPSTHISALFVAAFAISLSMMTLADWIFYRRR
jgi:hypothetical protein